MQQATSIRRAESRGQRRPGETRFYLLPRDGWLSLLLTALLLYITVVSVQSVQPVWTSGLQSLSFAMAFGVLAGYVATQQYLIPNGLMHLAATVFGILTSLIITAKAALGGSVVMLARNTVIWFGRALTPNAGSSDNSVFLLFLTTLTFLLAYMTMWLIFHTRRPWLALLANAVVLLINLNETTTDEFYFLIIFLVLALLLLVRFTLAENVRQWRRVGLRFSPDLSWDFMQAGAIVAVIVTLIPNLLPIANPDPALVNFWNSPRGPLATLSQRAQSLFSGAGGRGSGSYEYFSTNLRLVGNVDLPNTVQLHYTVGNTLQNDPTQYLITEAYSTYDGVSQWTRGQTVDQVLGPNQTNQASTAASRVDTYRIFIDAAPNGGQRNLFAPGSSAASFTAPGVAQVNTLTGEPVTWLAQPTLATNQSYLARGYVSTATVDQLSKVPYPADGASVYPGVILAEYLPSNERVDPYVASVARQVTQGTPDMYDAAVAMENYLRTFTYSAHNPNPPANEDAAAWFLHRKIGFCTFFASAMALMGRSLGMPTRIVSGYTNGVYDQSANSYVVKGTQMHTWTQIYFAQYGWINFEPTASFSPFARAIGQSGTTSPTGPSTTPSATAAANHGRTQTTHTAGAAPATGVAGSVIRVGLALFLTLLALLALAGAALWWWRSLFRKYSPTAASFARLALLGWWAGAPPRAWQTSREYARQLAGIAPDQQAAIEQVGALYARERWGGPLSPEEIQDIPALYDRGRLGLTAVLIRRARRAPALAAERGRRLLSGVRRRVSLR